MKFMGILRPDSQSVKAQRYFESKTAHFPDLNIHALHLLNICYTFDETVFTFEC